MSLSKWQFMMAAAEIRVVAAQLDATMSQLRDTNQWTGPDAERFYREWDANVRTRLYSAAGKLEGLMLVPFA